MSRSTIIAGHPEKLYLVIRGISVAVRIGFPMLVLLIANQEELGRYYLYNSAIAFILFAFTFESGIYFAKRALRPNTRGRRTTHFWQIVHVQTIFLVFLGIPAIAGFLAWLGTISVILFASMGFYLASEIIVNEFGKYLTNVNAVAWVVLRDLYRAVGFVTAGLVSLLAVGAVVAWQYFVAFGVFNLILAAFELREITRSNFSLRKAVRRKSYHAALAGTVVTSARGLMAQASLAFAYPLLERMLLERTLGLGTVGAYALLSSIFQSFIATVFLPHIAKMRSILLARRPNAVAGAQRLTGLKSFLLQTLLVGTAIIVAVQAALYFAGQYPLLRKINVSPGFAVAALLAVLASNLISIVAPDYARKGNLARSTVVTTSIYGASLSLFWTCHRFFSADGWVLPLILGGGFIAQILARRRYF